MKFLTLFAAGAAASSLVQRDLQTCLTAIQQITSATRSLSQAVSGFNGAGQVASLQQASMSTIQTVNQQTQNVAGTSALTQTEALQLTQPVQDLSNLVNDAVNTLIGKKQTFVSAGVGSVVEDQLTQLRDAAANFSKTLIGKVPQGLQDIANQLAAPITQALDKAVAAFQGTGGSSGSGSTGPTSTGSGSPTSSPSSYPTGGSGSGSSSTSSAPAETGSSGASAPVGGSGSGSATGSSAPPMYTGAASHQAAGFGAVAVAALAAVAAF